MNYDSEMEWSTMVHPVIIVLLLICVCVGVIYGVAGSVSSKYSTLGFCISYLTCFISLTCGVLYTIIYENPVVGMECRRILYRVIDELVKVNWVGTIIATVAFIFTGAVIPLMLNSSSSDSKDAQLFKSILSIALVIVTLAMMIVIYPMII